MNVESTEISGVRFEQLRENGESDEDGMVIKRWWNRWYAWVLRMKKNKGIFELSLNYYHTVWKTGNIGYGFICGNRRTFMPWIIFYTSPEFDFATFGDILFRYWTIISWTCITVGQPFGN